MSLVLHSISLTSQPRHLVSVKVQSLDHVKRLLSDPSVPVSDMKQLDLTRLFRYEVLQLLCTGDSSLDLLLPFTRIESLVMISDAVSAMTVVGVAPLSQRCAQLG